MRYCDSVILAPAGHRSDLILDHQGQLYKVQVKDYKQALISAGELIIIVGKYEPAKELKDNIPTKIK